ncbi:MAG: class I SAM-dependent methyltransferase [Paenibacillus macerans]|uniref:Methyltransferase n=1 Tax=Paenibacillus macerans TaxID=44252 RepID=A0A090XUY4_PAEMA|nr:class I SAM-dependent methyltransferase [Paenibacillus macerans]KFM83910.1 methyltransferase domain protein [Paenibacillus macerans]MBS5911078.1 class I SAM-dependent methyltransferase [Paenibacillus macerans]MCY7559346.1 class I SAM-dependent methyltransferase [Paenibacillus macerans]MDU5948616.1 class I SAM-dependent methyltransferase [Paenibacillus macerans]MDU7473314.1 class I SAM-dependent methyltransferase [Paenibacillus macerans]
MSDHYYSSNPTAEHDRKVWDATLRGQTFRFVSDAGVFAKGGVDFGSRTLIEAMEIPQDAKVLDVGCGYGPIGLAAAKLAGRGHVTMIDVNARAVDLARENAELNQVSNVTILESDLFAALKDQKFDVVLTNPPIRAGKSIVHAIFEGAYERLESGGALWIVIQKKQGAPSAKAKLESLFAQVEEVTKDKGYRIYKAVKA